MQNLTFETILAQFPDAAIVVDRSGLIRHANKRAEQLFGYGDDELAGLPLGELVPTEKRHHHTRVMQQFLQAPARRTLGSGLDLYGQRKDGSRFLADIALGPIGSGSGLVILATIRDISSQRLAAEELQQVNRALRLLSASNRTLLRCSSEETLLADVCRIAVEIGGYRLAWVGMAMFDTDKSVSPAAWCGAEEGFLSSAQMSWADGSRGTSAMAAAIRTGTIQLRQDILNDPQLAPWHEDARSRNYQSAIALPLRLSTDVIGALAIYAPEPHAFHQHEIELLNELADDLSFGIQTLRIRHAHEAAQVHMRQLAYYDRLTGLPNRSLFTEQLDRAIAAATAENRPFALLLLNLGYLREINEVHGHLMGDQILIRVAGQLQQLCNHEQFVARFSGNDFTIICPGLDQFGAALFGDVILKQTTAPFHLSGHRFSIGGNIGVVIFPGDGETSQELLSKADLAMAKAQEARGGACFYRADMGQQLNRTLDLAHRLERAMQENHLALHYQPKIDLINGQVVGAEALLRWHDPELGWIGPAEFIPIAEARGMMVELGNWVLRTACRQVRAWQDAGHFCHGRIAVNVSARQLADPAFLKNVTDIIAEAGIPTSCIELELTESVLMEDPERVAAILTELKLQGLSLAVDDFGTGYSSLVYLKRFPLDTLKIDQAFVRDMLVDQNDRAIVATIIAMAQQLGLTPVAEGVETEGQHQALKQLGCRLAQGFHFSRPEPAEEFTRKRLRRTTDAT